MKNILLPVFTALALSASASATIVTVGTYDENTVNADTVDAVATGSMLDLTQTKTRASEAFSNNTGGVWDFDTTVTGEWDGDWYTSFTLSYGTSQANSIGLTVSPGSNASAPGIARGNQNPISGSFHAGQGSLDERVWTPTVPLTMIASTSLDRGAAGNQARLLATLQDSTVLSTTLAPSNTDTLHVLTATAANPITSFTWDNNGTFVRWDDLAFEVVPEPSAALLGSLGILVLLRRRR